MVDNETRIIRQIALDKAMFLASKRNDVSAEEIIEDAKKIEAFLLGAEAPKGGRTDYTKNKPK